MDKDELLEMATQILKDILEIVPDEHMFQKGEDPHPPSCLRVDIIEFLNEYRKIKNK